MIYQNFGGKMMFNHDALRNLISAIGRSRLNSATKYPSVPTFHEMTDKGLLTDKIADLGPGPFFLTEKIDGTNTRIIITPHGYLIGSREQILYAQGDIIGDPALNIVNHVRPIAENIWSKRGCLDDSIVTIYGETYGGKVTAGSKQYTSNGTYGFRVFDLSKQNINSIPSTLEDIAIHRDARGGFADNLAIMDFCRETGIPRVHELGYEPNTDKLELSHDDAYTLLKWTLPQTFSALDSNAGKKAEGVVISNRDRTKIAKLRFDDYERVLMRKKIAA